MTVFAIRILGLLHGTLGLALLFMAAVMPRRPEAKPMPRGQLKYVIGKWAISGLALITCAFVAWLRPALAWIPASLSMLSYAPGPTWIKLCLATGHYRIASPDTGIGNVMRPRRNSIIGASVRAALIVLLAVAGNSR